MADPAASPIALILAGSRPGVDPLAAEAGVRHKALITLDGTILLARVAASLREAEIETIGVSASPGPVSDAAAALDLRVIPAAAGPSLSVGAALTALGTPLVVTTADHALLRPEWVRDFIATVPAGADVAVLLARRESIEAALPGSKRTYLRFADGAWSGCNLFYFATPRSAAALELWKAVEADRKRPWRIVRRFGIGMLVRYLLGRLTLREAVAHLGRLAGIEAAVVESPYGLAAVDVDSLADLAAVRSIVEDRLLIQ